jgi:hypothetical protein
VTFITQTEAGPNTVRIFVDGVQQDVKASTTARCWAAAGTPAN